MKNVDLVILTIGGNDIKFDNFAGNCVFKADARKCSTAYNDSLKELNKLSAKLKATYAAIKKVVSAKTKIFVLSYPNIVPYAENLPCAIMTYFQRTLAIDLERRLNKTIGNAVKTAGVTFSFLDATATDSPFIGHTACDDDPYLNGPVFPQTVYSFHPNRKGHNFGYAAMIARELFTLKFL